MKKLTVLGILILSLSMTVFGVVVANDSENAYEGDDGLKMAAGNQLKPMIILGAGYFLGSNAGFQQVLHLVEMAELTGFNYDEMRRVLNEAIAGLESAKATYGEVKALAGQTPYNPAVISALEAFDYFGFMQKNRLNPVIFVRVAALLVNGNVTGVYEEIYARTSEMLELLYTVKSSFDNNRFPGIPVLWQLNQLYAETLLFGQYTAMVFMNLND